MNRIQLLLIAILCGSVAVVGGLAMAFGEHAHPLEPQTIATPPPPPALAALPVLHNHRIKPFAIAADELCYAVTGKIRFGVGLDGRPASSGAVVLDWLRDGEVWKTRPLVEVQLIALREEIGLEGSHITLEELGTPAVQQVLARGWRARQAARAEREVKPIARVDAAAADLADREFIARHILTGSSLQIAPLLATPEQRAWAEGLDLGAEATGDPEWRHQVRSLLAAAARAEAAGGSAEAAWSLPEADAWIDLGSLAIVPDPLLASWPDPHGVGDAARALVAALRSRGDLDAPATALATAIRAAGAADARFPGPDRLGLELTYRRLRLFTWAWMACIAGGLLAAFGLARQRRVPRILGLVGLVAGIGLLAAGLGLRIILSADNAAVARLYDTFPFVAFVAAVLGLVFAIWGRSPVAVCAAGLAAGLCAMVGEALPPDHGAFLEPLQPVLRYRFWLWLHVKIIVGSYGAFLLAWMMANVELWRAAGGRRPVDADRARDIHRVMQVGLVLCTAGTLLGGVWADFSWGRFWGWDPKEVWALVIILVYLVPMHLRYIGAVSTTGLAAWAVCGFLSVVMSWYGVNFLLGAGLHAYATGDGFADSVSTDQIIVLGLCAAQIVLTWSQVVLTRRRADAAPTA